MAVPKIRVKLVTWDEVHGWAFRLARLVEESGWRPDVVVAIARGGYVPARLVCDILDVHDLLSVQVLHWGRAAEITAEAHVKYPVPVKLEGKRVLLIDDICDTGASIIVAKKHLEERAAPAEIRTGVMQWISAVAKIKPDYYVEELRDWVWYQYPWCRVEDTTNFIEKIVGETGRKEWTRSELVEEFKEWYGIDVGEEVFEEAFKKLVERGVLVLKD